MMCICAINVFFFHEITKDIGLGYYRKSSIKPSGGLFNFRLYERGLIREGGLIEGGGGGLFKIICFLRNFTPTLILHQ